MPSRDMEALYDQLVGLSYECVLDEGAWLPLLSGLIDATGRQQGDLLVRGLTPEQCAEHLGTSINTIRSQLRALFRKTQTSRQAELVSLLVRLGQR